MPGKIIGGTAVVRVGGKSVDVMGNIKHSFDLEEKEIRRGVDGHFNVKVTPVTPFIEIEVSDSSLLNVQELSDAENVSVTIEKRNGKLETLVDADQVNRVEVDDIESTFTLRFEGKAKPVETLGSS